jgi:predicted small metal-binding protein
MRRSSQRKPNSDRAGSSAGSDNRRRRLGESNVGEGRIDMAKVYVISCRDAGVDCDFQARGSSLEEVMQLCAEHGIQEHNMKAFGPELYTKMRRCVKTLEEGTSGPTS